MSASVGKRTDSQRRTGRAVPGKAELEAHNHLRRLSERGVVKNENCVVTSLVSRTEAESAEVGELLETRFQGSLPAFISAFSRLDRVSDADMDEMLRMIRQYREENHHDEPAD